MLMHHGWRPQWSWTFATATALACVCALSIVSAAPALARHRLPTDPPWTSKVNADSQAGAENIVSNTACTALVKSINAKIDAMKTMQKDIDTSNAAMPTSLFGVYKKYMGEDYTSLAIKKKMHDLQLAHQAAEDLNRALVNLKCAAIDIDQKLKEDGKAAAPFTAQSKE